MTSHPKQTEEDQPFLKYTDDNLSTPPSEKDFLPQSRKPSLLPYALVFIITSFLWLTVYFMATDTPHWRRHQPVPGERHNITSNARLLSCGNTSVDARAAGCTYDTLLNHWVPAPCFDPEFLEEYEDDGSWAGYADEGLTQMISVQEMMERDFYYTSVRDHINHCAMIWKKQFVVLFEERRAVDSIVASPGHTDHCAYYLTLEGRNLTEATKVEVGFAGCWVRD